MNLLVTIVTPSYNSAATIEATIESVLTQSYPQIEYIIMDGGSTDETVAIARQLRQQANTDLRAGSRTADAINKGWRRRRGDGGVAQRDDRYLPGRSKRRSAISRRIPT